ncbi:MAG: tRNA 2-thiouridine(34) synthase MnmA [Candidatus Paceibacterota bacterium]
MVIKNNKTVFIGVSPNRRVLPTGQAGGVKPTVFVGVSGGVDSSVSAALLKEATPKNFKKFFGRPTPKGFRGYNVVGVFIRTWTPDFIECTWKNERRDAMRVCAHLNIPFLECDAEKEYKKSVVDYMIEEYKKGNTPNPDVMCNREVKFGVFWKFAQSHGADFIATGHYARKSPLLVEEGVGGGDPKELPPRPAGTPPRKGGEEMHKLLKGIDSSKDQVYFLWTLTQEDLSHILFPIGHLKKTEVRKLAKKYNLPTATKKDSQGICFLGLLDMKDFLRHYIKSEKGNVLLARHDSELGNEKGPARPHESSGAGGEIIGNHNGAVFFTLGERHGFTLNKHSENDEPLYVISKDIKNNTITVSPRPCLGEEDEPHRTVLCNNANWISGIPEKDKVYIAQIRYHGEFLDCKVVVTGQTCEITFDKNVIVDKGQSIVIYDGDICLGGGVVI